MSKPATPRHAASLIIHRRGARGTEVFMGRRHANARFKPGVYVFPGGMIERSDYRVSAASALDPSISNKLAVGGSPHRARALAMAAVRETFEETGLLAASTGHIGNSSDASWAAFRERGLAPDLGRLAYLGRAITPTQQSIRFHARFFFVDAAHVHGELTPSDELEDLQWVPLDATHDLNMMKVTQFMLDTLARRLAGDLSKTPLITFTGGQPRLRWD
ncbi:MAG: NUDIX hydrolase [Gammaproteobacteria bacterium]